MSDRGSAWNTVGEAFATAFGDEAGAQRFENRRKEAKQLSDQELELQTKQILSDVSALQDRRSKLDQNSPTYQQDLQSIDQALHDARQAFTDLYHPEKNPGALSKVHGFIQSHLGRNKKQNAPATPAEAKKSLADRMAGIESVAYAPQAQDPYLTPAEQKQAARIKAGIDARAGVERPESENWVPATVKLADGKEITLQRNSRDGRWTYLDGTDVPKELLSGATVTGKGENKPPTSNQITQEAYENAFDPPVKWAQMTPEQKAFYPRWKAMQTAAENSGQYVMAVPQPNGGIQAVTIQRTGGKTYPGATPSGLRQPETTPGTPKTPADAKARIPKPKAGVIGTGPTIGGRMTPPEVKAKEAADLLRTDATAANTYLDERLKGNKSPTADTSIVFSWVRANVRGAGRMTNTEIEQGLKSGSFGTRLSNAYNRAVDGTLDDDFISQMVRDINRAYQAAKNTADKSGASNAPTNPYRH
jgi:hypothetical protein